MAEYKKGEVIGTAGGVVVEIEQTVLPPNKWYQILDLFEQLPPEQIKQLIEFLRLFETRGDDYYEFTGIQKDNSLTKALNEYMATLQSEKAKKPRGSVGIALAANQIKTQNPKCSAAWAWKQLLKMAMDGEEFTAEDGMVYALKTEPETIVDDEDRARARILSTETSTNKPDGRGMRQGNFKTIFSKI